MPQKIMNEEIKKYQGRIYYLDLRTDRYGNKLTPRAEKATWIFDTSCYDHCSFELHHVIKFTPYEKNTSWYKERGLENCLILIPKKMHQHLENPIHGLTDDEFFELYKIHKYEILFIKDEFEKGNYPLILSKPSEYEIDYDGCFDELEEGVC